MTGTFVGDALGLVEGIGEMVGEYVVSWLPLVLLDLLPLLPLELLLDPDPLEL